MIADHQPRIFSGLPIKVVFSSVADGSIAKGGGGESEQSHHNNRDAFLSKNEFQGPKASIFIRYGEDKSYRDIKHVETSELSRPIECDALICSTPSVTVTLPVADCAATVVYDMALHICVVLHLGRHSSMAHAIEAAADEMKKLGSTPEDWLVWMSPHMKSKHHILDYFEPEQPEEWESHTYTDDSGKIHVDIASHNAVRFQLLGVKPEHIEISEVDTYEDERYFSHRAAADLNEPSRQGRMMIAAMLMPREAAATL